jgi:hypothetical protein
MKLPRFLAVVPICLVCAAVVPLRAEPKHTLKEAATVPPPQLAEPIRKLLNSQSIQVFDAKGDLFCEVWFRKSIPCKATPAQVQNGLSYQELEQTTLLGVIQFAQEASDYRGQPVKPGVYTLRLAFQPQDGDHMGTAPHTEFCLITSAELDQKADPMDAKALHDQSGRSLGTGHPGSLLLFPHTKPEPKPSLADPGMDHLVLKHTLMLDVAGKRIPLGIALTILGKSAAA